MDHDGRAAFERPLEEFSPGQRFTHWPGRTITEAANDAFCYWTYNRQPLHLDAEYAKDSRFGQRLVNGMLILSTAVGMSIAGVSGGIIANLGFDAVVHHAPVFIGDTIYATSTVLHVRSSATNPTRGIVTLETSVANQRSEIVLTFTRRLMAPRKSAAP